MIDAAVAVFSAHGFQNASMDEISARAGISKPMVYAYFGSKDELFVACLHREGTRVMEAVIRVVHGTGVDVSLTGDTVRICASTG